MKKKKQRDLRVDRGGRYNKMQMDIINRLACCPKARFLNCVCAYSFRCKKHGDTHIGTHD